MLLIGTTVFSKDNEEFKIEGVLGSGGFGQVFKISNGRTNLALKVANADGMTTDEFDALLNEGRLAQTIIDKNVIKIHYFHDGKTHPDLPPYLIMDLASDGSLRDFIDEKKTSNSHLKNDELHALFVQIASGMKAINEKLVHRDLHPGNILLSGNILKITDFGLSKIVDAKTRTNTIKGIQHIYYKAPESWKMMKNEIQMDMYSAGIIFFELATLQYPYSFPGVKDRFVEVQHAHTFDSVKKPSTYNKNINETMDEIILKLLKKRPEDRYSNWDRVIEVLNSKNNSSGAAIDVSGLLAKSRATDAKIEAQMAEEEKKRAEHQSKIDHLRYSVNLIFDELQSLVEVFNKQTDSTKLVMRRSNDFLFEVQSTKTNQSLRCEFHLAEALFRTQRDPWGRGNHTKQDVLKIDGKEVLFWGIIANTTGRGVNVLLTLDTENDQYGTWKIVEHKWNALNNRRDGRPEPFPLVGWDEFAHQIQVIRALGLIDSKVFGFSLKSIEPLLNEVL